MLHIEDFRPGQRATPLQTLRFQADTAGRLLVRDGAAEVYADRPIKPGRAVNVQVGGVLGWHTATIEPLGGEALVDRAKANASDDAQRAASSPSIRFRVEVRTHIDDQGGFYALMLRHLHNTMFEYGEVMRRFWHGRLYRFFVSWIRDHVHVLKGMKYFYPNLQEAIDLFHHSQREDGMVWDNVKFLNPGGKRDMWQDRFEYGDFIRYQPEDEFSFKRIPVENDVEYLYVEGIYNTWKADGDEAWLADKLDSAIGALNYSVTDPYRFSEKYKLLKRGFTIDTWDFQPRDDALISNDRGDVMVVQLDRTRFGIFYGDNTGYIAACHQLSQMLEHVGRSDEARQFAKRGEQLKQRLDTLAWNGRFYTHHIPEDPKVERDLGVDQSEQISLSNAYSLNRGVDHDQARAIIHSYQRIRDNLPEGSPGEWYTMYPPFERGFGRHGKWQYVNGGVCPVIAGELAHGAFEHGEEAYGADILKRIEKLPKLANHNLAPVYTGAHPRPPKRKLIPLDIRNQANTDFLGTDEVDRPEAVAGWTGEGENDLRDMPVGKRTLAGVKWHIPDPKTNGRRGCLGLSRTGPYTAHGEVPVNQAAGSIYLLHTCAGVADNAGMLTIEYQDGSRHQIEIIHGKHISGWWMPADLGARIPQAMPRSQVAWEGPNPACSRVGVLAVGFDNPHPDKPIAKLLLDAPPTKGTWLIQGMTISDQPVWFPANTFSGGMPNGWPAAACVYALIEGLAGVVDRGVAFNQVELSPRWAAAGINRVNAAVTYPASEGYLAYQYRHEPAKKKFTLTLTGSGDSVHGRILLPAGAKRLTAAYETPAGQSKGELETTLEKVEKSSYATFTVSQPTQIHTITLEYA